MTDQTAEIFNEGVKRTLSLKSDQWGIFGPTYRVKIPVTDLGNDMFKVTKEDWDNTVGPIFERMRSSILNGNKIDADRYRAIANGYNAMESGQYVEFHTLMQAFSAVADPSQLDEYPNAENNKHVDRLRAFVETLEKENAVMVSGTQLKALANIARGAMEYAREGLGVPDAAKSFFSSHDDKHEHIRYTNGLINAVI